MEKPIAKSMSTKELAALYGVGICTFKRWISPFSGQVGEKVGWYYKPSQVRTIFEVLGEPF